MVRPSWAKVLASCAAAIVLGGAGMFLYIFYVPLDATRPLVPRLTSYLLCWPVVVIGHLAYGPSPISNFDPILIGKFGWLALWIYYYILVSIGSTVWGRQKDRDRQQA